MFSQESRSRCALGERVGTRHPLLLSRWSSAGPPCTSHKPSWCSVASDSIAEITHAAKALVDYVGSVIALRFPCPVAAHSASKRRRPPRRSVSTRRMNSRMSKNTSEAWDTFQKISLKYRDPWDTFQKIREIRLDEGSSRLGIRFKRCHHHRTRAPAWTFRSEHSHTNASIDTQI